jgi:hypothetical protein
MSLRATIESTVAAGASVVRHLGWWLDWQARARPSDGGRVFEEAQG